MRIWAILYLLTRGNHRADRATLLPNGIAYTSLDALNQAEVSPTGAGTLTFPLLRAGHRVAPQLHSTE